MPVISSGLISIFYWGGILYSYIIRKALVNLGKEDHARYGGSTPELITDIAKNFSNKVEATWIIGEGGAAGPAKSPYGHNAGYTALVVVGPVNRTRIIETGCAERTKNMSDFATGLLRLFLEVLDEHHPEIM